MRSRILALESLKEPLPVPCKEDWTFAARLHSCYLAPHHPLTWHDAENYCRNEGAHLVSVNSAEESRFIGTKHSSWGDCAALSSSQESHAWVAIDCDYSQFYLCEMPANGIAPVVMNANAGEFYSPGYPDKYPNDVLVLYFIELQPFSIFREKTDTAEVESLVLRRDPLLHSFFDIFKRLEALLGKAVGHRPKQMVV
ncbi:lectin C-type domain protein [Ancylostoma duodenale]|uniref:Lectin C-type domain protein n=1 Tax=Ancylostoma duodenale TaxID=51022 RepID=A0A0C2H7G2_9BILA|nr:lectin C-type domain protein [Ancylostoma duodenale]